MKYDCTKTRDCIHEYHRVCDSHPAGCEISCPLIGADEICGFDIFENEDNIALLQKWSDEHPEIPKLTREEYAFLQAFKVTADKQIERKIGHLFLVMGYTTMEIWPTMFSFIKEGETWFLGDLLKLEVEG